MNNSRFKTYLILTLVLSGLLPIIGSIFLHSFLSDRYWIDEPLHSVFEALGSFTAISLAILILLLQKEKRIPGYYLWVSCALIGMGLLDGFHAFSPPGNSFIWLHCMAVLIGGFLFAMVWLPNRIAQSRPASILSIMVAVIAIIFSVFAAAFPETLPSMINDGIFTIAAKATNILSGLFFLLAAMYFVIRYRSDRSIEDFLFANFCLLNGWAGLLFPLSQLWYADWWFWHLLRLIAYFTVISYMFINFQRSEAELKRHRDDLVAIFENLPLGIAYLDAEFKFLNANKFFYDLTGLGEENLIGKHCYETVGEYTDSTRKGLEKICSFCKKDECFSTRRPTVIERPLGGSIVKVTTVPQLDKDGNIFRFLEIVENITERKLSEAALLESEERYRKLVESSPDTIVIHSEGKIIFTNPAGAKLLGAANPDQLIGKEIMDFVHPDYREPVKEQLWQRKEEREDVLLIEEKFVRLDGSVIDVEVAATPFIHQGKHGMQVIIRDITEKKKLETQFLRAQRLESIGTLASGIAHDINNVLTPMMLSLQLLQEKFTDHKSQKLLNVLERSTQRGASLIKQVQSFARGVQGQRAVLQVSHLISEILQITKETFPRYIEIRTDIQKDLWTISGDATQLHQVLMNLCLNARDAMPDGGILSISAENLFIDENYARMNIDAKVGQYIVITVSDTGIGIPPKILDRIFEPFFTTKQPGKGTGLGLSTALTIVKSHGGFLNVYSEVGKGTVFKVYLPVAKTTEAQKVDEKQLELLAGHGESILVVDDEAMVHEITSSVLESHGYRVFKANDGKEAIALYSQHRKKIKLVLMDMMMPVMDGRMSIQELCKINPEVKIIAVSGLTEKVKLENIDNAQVKAFLMKPYTAERLLKTIHEVLGGKQDETLEQSKATKEALMNQ